ncbi:MAG: O-antigen ligase family protein [Elusimicrobiota bacterium]
MKISETNKLFAIHCLLFAVFLLTPFFNGSKDPTAIFVFETVVFIVFFITINFHKIQKTLIDIPILLFLIFTVFSTATTLYLNSSVNMLFLVLSYLMFFYCLITVYNKVFRKFFYDGLVLISFIISGIVILQFFSGKTPKATFPNPNLAAGYISAGASFILAFLFFSETKLKTKIAFSILFLAFWIAIALTHSRGGLFSLLCGILTVFFLKFKKWGIFIFTIGVLIVFISLPKGVITNIVKMDGGDVYAFKRLEIWNAAIKIIKENPVLGTGPGNFELLFYKYNFPANNLLAKYAKITRFAHNEFLQIAAEGGLFAFAVFVWILIIIIRSALKSSNNSVVVFAAILGHSFVDFNLHLPATMFVLIFATADILYDTQIDPYKYENNLPRPYKERGLLKFLNITNTRRYIIFLLLALFVFNTLNFFLKPIDAEKYKKLADKFVNTQPEKAVELYKKTVKYSPNDFDYRRQLGELFYLTNRRTDAIEQLKKSVELNPNSTFAIMSLAKIYYDTQEFNKAEFYLLKALHNEPNYLTARYFLAMTAEKQHRFQTAEKEYQNIISIYKLFQGTSSPSIQTATTLSGYEKTLLSIDIADVYNSLGFFYMNTGKLQDAIVNYNISLEIKPVNAVAYSNLASVYFIEKKYSDALHYANLAAYYEPEEPAHLKNLILIYQKLHNDSEIKRLKNKIEFLEKQNYVKER